ncbi:MAG: PilN domain-containing protein [Armatimonadetes bacterium]|nr:PilN domain-containing protein [Armatimonadota bacterium]
MAATIQIDLGRPEPPRLRIDPTLLVLLVVIGGCWATFFAYGQYLARETQTRRHQVAEVDHQISDLERSLPVLEERRNKIRQLREQIQLIQSLVQDPVRYANLLQEISGLLPPNLWLGSLTIEPQARTLKLAGTVAELPGRLPFASLAQLLMNLDESPYFLDGSLASVKETSPQPGGIRAFSFQLTAHYDPEAAARVPPAGSRSEEGENRP